MVAYARTLPASSTDLLALGGYACARNLVWLARRSLLSSCYCFQVSPRSPPPVASPKARHQRSRSRPPTSSWSTTRRPSCRAPAAAPRVACATRLGTPRPMFHDPATTGRAGASRSRTTRAAYWRRSSVTRRALPVGVQGAMFVRRPRGGGTKERLCNRLSGAPQTCTSAWLLLPESLLRRGPLTHPRVATATQTAIGRHKKSWQTSAQIFPRRPRQAIPRRADDAPCVLAPGAR